MLARVPLELLKLLLAASSLGDLELIDSNHLAQGPAFSNSDNVSSLYIPKTGGQVHRHVLVTLLKVIVLSDVIEIVPVDDNGPLHLHLVITPDRIRPQMETLPVKGHFLSREVPSMASLGVLNISWLLFMSFRSRAMNVE